MHFIIGKDGNNLFDLMETGGNITQLQDIPQNEAKHMLKTTALERKFDISLPSLK